MLILEINDWTDFLFTSDVQLHAMPKFGQGFKYNEKHEFEKIVCKVNRIDRNRSERRCLSSMLPFSPMILILKPDLADQIHQR